MKDEEDIIMLDNKGNRVKFEISEETKSMVDKMRKETEQELRPFYEKLGVNIETEDLNWTSGEVFVTNKKTKERREIGDQKRLNKEMLNHAINFAGKINK